MRMKPQMRKERCYISAGRVEWTCTQTPYLTRMASLMLNRPGFSSMPNNRLPLGIQRSLARACPSGYVARMTKYEENEGAFDLK